MQLEAARCWVNGQYNGLSSGNGKAAVVQLLRAFTSAGYPLDADTWLAHSSPPAESSATPPPSLSSSRECKPAPSTASRNATGPTSSASYASAPPTPPNRRAACPYRRSLNPRPARCPQPSKGLLHCPVTTGCPPPPVVRVRDDVEGRERAAWPLPPVRSSTVPGSATGGFCLVQPSGHIGTRPGEQTTCGTTNAVPTVWPKWLVSTSSSGIARESRFAVDSLRRRARRSAGGHRHPLAVVQRQS